MGRKALHKWWEKKKRRMHQGSLIIVFNFKDGKESFPFSLRDWAHKGAHEMQFLMEMGPQVRAHLFVNN